jgi:ribosomal protein L24
MMLEIIRQKQIIQLRTLSSDSINFANRTSQKSNSIRKYDSKLLLTLHNIESDEDNMNQKTMHRFQQFVQDAMIIVNTLNLIIRDLESMQRVIKSRKTRASLEDQVIAKSVFIKISQCRKLCSIQKKKEKKRLKRKKERDAKKTKSSRSHSAEQHQIFA